MRWLVGADDAGAAGYRNLIDADRHRDADRQPDVFVVEGVRAIRQLLDEGWPLDSLLFSDLRIRGRPDLLADAARAGVPVYGAGQELFDRITGYHAHRGALALARRPAPRPLSSVVAGARLLLVVEGVNDHENLGALFRNAAAFGAGGVVLDPSAADPLYRRSVRVSVGHVLRVPFARAQSWPGDLSVVRSAGFRVAALTPAGDVTIEELAGADRDGAGGSVERGAGGEPGGAGTELGSGPGAGGRWALMVGAEGDGLSAPALDAADVRMRIPIAAGVDSLNVATAAAIAMHRLASP